MSKGVMVIGGGLVGVQAALDLAEAQVQVYLVERSPFLGGRVAQFDKIVPNDESSICLLTPKLLTAVRHPNIRVLTHSEITALSGEPGNFTVDVLRHPRYVEEDKCSGCGRCEHQCPVRMPTDFESGGRAGKTIYTPFPKAVPYSYTIEKRGLAPCRDACPAGVNAQGYVALISRGKYREAFDLVREAIPFPGVCGRICNHPCEEVCNRREYDDAIAIRNLKRFVADFALTHRSTAEKNRSSKPRLTKPTRAKVAIVGAGPAGLTAAKELASQGYKVTVFEATEVAGGMLALGIPAFRLPREILKQEIDEIKSYGVEIRTSTRVGDLLPLSELGRLGYQAIFLAVGGHAPRKLGIEGEELQGVTDCVTLLRNFNLGRRMRVGRRVVVIGGGNAAVDAARTIIRLHSERVDVLYRRGKDEMPADEHEVIEAELEGVNFHFLVSPIRLDGVDGNLTGIECQRMRLGTPGHDGRRTFEPVPDSNFRLEVDTVVVAVGQAADVATLATKDGLIVSSQGTIPVDEQTLATTLPGVFAGGDAVTGPATVIEAIAAGRKAAISIDRYLRGVCVASDSPWQKGKPVRLDPGIEVERLQRHTVPSLALDLRYGTFREVEPGYTPEMAIREAERCLNCGVCSECLECERACQLEAINHDSAPQNIQFNVGALILATGFDRIKATVSGAGHLIQHPNIIGDLEFERLAVGQGPQSPGLHRYSDGRRVERITFMVVNQSARPVSNAQFMLAVRNALLARGLDPNMAQIDVIAPNLPVNDHDALNYLARVRRYPQIRIIVGEVVGMSDNQGGSVSLTVRQESAAVLGLTSDLVVLSSSIAPWEGTPTLGAILEVDLREDGTFAESETPLASTRPGIYLSGSLREPRDTADSLAEASAAAMKALSHVRTKRQPRRARPVEQDLTGAPPKVGVFLCRCGGNISNVIGFGAIRDTLQSLPEVSTIEEVSYACSELGSEMILERIRNLRLNRVVLGSCACCSYDQICPSCSHSRVRAKRNLLDMDVLNRNLFEFVNIREQCAWVHTDDKAAATAKASELLSGAIARAVSLTASPGRTTTIEKGVLVVGGGLAGLQCAVELAREGIPLFVIEREKQWGGRLRQIAHPYFDMIADLVTELKSRKAKLLLGTEIESIEGCSGQYEVSLRKGERRQTIRVGAIVTASGADIYQPVGEFGYGQFPNVITNSEWDQRVASGRSKGTRRPIGKVAFIQCVGSRQDNVSCSRFCCDASLRQAIALAKEGIGVTVYHRDLCLDGSSTEARHEAALRLGVKFIRFSPESPPQITGSKIAQRIGLPGTRSERCDLVILAVGLRPRKHPLGAQIELLPNGEASKAAPVLEPGLTNVPTLLVCGTAQRPLDLRDTLIHGSAVAAKAVGLQAKGELPVSATVARVDDERCRACGMCERVCEFGAVRVRRDGPLAAQVDQLICRSCGACAAHCPSGAIVSGNFRPEQVTDLLRSMLLRV